MSADWLGTPRQRNPWHTGRTCNETAQVSHSYPCPCCGHRVLGAMPGSYKICPVCFWEDDGAQFRWPTMGGGANKVSLIEAQRTSTGLRRLRPAQPAVRSPTGRGRAARPRGATHRSDTRLLRGLGNREPLPVARRPLGALLVAPHLLAP
ncbi:CPCC family cysteine-rich protein [Streptomyces anulatus]